VITPNRFSGTHRPIRPRKHATEGHLDILLIVGTERLDAWSSFQRVGKRFSFCLARFSFLQ
jgi:hypothetical protein